MFKPIDSYTCTETLNWTAQLTQEMEEINQSSHTILGPITARIVGLVSIPLISLTEAGAHVVLAAGKGITGLFVSPYNCVASTCFPEYSLPKELEFSSALVHLILVVECIFTAALLPFVCLLNPSRADAWMNSRLDKAQVDNSQDLKEETSTRFEELTLEVKQVEEKLSRAKLRGQKRLASKGLELETANAKIEELTLTVKEVEEKLLRAKLRGQKRLENKELELKNSKIEFEQLKVNNSNQIEELTVQHKINLEKLEKEMSVSIADTNVIPNVFIAESECAAKHNPTDLFEMKQEYDAKVLALTTEHSKKIEEINSLKEIELKSHYENLIQSLNEKIEKGVSNLENTSKAKETELEKHSQEIAQIQNSHKEKISHLESQFKAEIEKITDSENAKAKEIETLTITLDLDRKTFLKTQGKLEKELNMKNTLIDGLEEDKAGMSSTYDYQLNQINKLNAEKNELIQQLQAEKKEKQSIAIAKEQYDIQDIVRATDLRHKHKNIIIQSSGVSLQYITLPKVEKLIIKIQDIMKLVEENPNIRLNFKMSGDEWEGDVEEIEPDNQSEGFLANDEGVDLTKSIIIENDTANVFLTNSTFGLGGSAFLTDSVIGGQRSPDMETLIRLNEYFNKFKVAIEKSISNKIHSPRTLNDKLILMRINHLQNMELIT